jgi:RNA polymerase sigma factor (sigma-70 family)
MVEGTAFNAEFDGASSLELLERAKSGDSAARDELIARYLPRLRRWASGRMPEWVRDGLDTQDLVQEAVINTFRRIEAFQPRSEGALQAYLRQGVLNRIRDQHRRAVRRPVPGVLDSQAEDPSPSPLDVAIGRQAVERYEAALARLREDDRAAVIARVEMGASNEEIARMLGKPTANAARMALERALVRLAREMQKDG